MPVSVLKYIMLASMRYLVECRRHQGARYRALNVEFSMQMCMVAVPGRYLARPRAPRRGVVLEGKRAGSRRGRNMHEAGSHHFADDVCSQAATLFWRQTRFSKRQAQARRCATPIRKYHRPWKHAFHGRSTPPMRTRIRFPPIFYGRRVGQAATGFNQN